MMGMSSMVEFAAGTHIDRAAEALVEMARREGEAIGRFNGVELSATRNTTPDAISAEYNRICEERAAAYRASPEGIAAAARANERRRSLQGKHDALMARLPSLDWRDDVAVLDWCCEMQEPSDHVGVIIKKDTILAEFAKHGFTPNMRTGSDYIADSRLVSHAYLIGQALAGIAHVAIHGIIHKFAAEWKERFGVGR